MAKLAKISWRHLLVLFLLTILVGLGEYALAWQFNDGKITRKVVGVIFLGMALPSILIGGVLRLFRPRLQPYFAITAAICLAFGFLLLLR